MVRESLAPPPYALDHAPRGGVATVGGIRCQFLDRPISWPLVFKDCSLPGGPARQLFARKWLATTKRFMECAL